MRSTHTYKVALIADTHLQDATPGCRKDSDFYRRQLEKLAWCLAQAPVMIHAGDFFHRPQPSHRLLYDVVALIKSSGTRVIVTPGQHDMIGHNLDTLCRTGLGILDKAGVVEVALNEPVPVQVSDRTVLVYPAPYGAEVPEPDQSQFSVLSMHRLVLGPNGEGYYNGFTGQGCTQFLRRYPFNLIVCGDNHKSFICTAEGRYFVNPGSMVRLTQEQRDHHPVLGILELVPEVKCYFVSIPHEEDVFWQPDKEVSPTAPNPALEELIRELKHSSNHLLSFKEELMRRVMEAKELPESTKNLILSIIKEVA